MALFQAPIHEGPDRKAAVLFCRLLQPGEENGAVMRAKLKGRASAKDTAKNKSDNPYSIANRVRFGRWRPNNREHRARFKTLIIECFDQGLISPAGAEFLIQRGGLRHV